MRIKGVIFDMDGTLIDSMQYWMNVGDEYLLSVGITPPSGLLDTIKDMSMIQSAEYFIKRFKLPYTVNQIIKKVNAIITDHYFYHIPAKPGVKDFLEQLKADGVKLCIATATDTHLARAALERLELLSYFDFIITCSDVGCGKDDPKIFFDALKTLGTELSETVIFEDALYAIKTAKAANFHVVGIWDKSAEEDTPEILKLADQYIKSYDEANGLVL